MGISVFPAPSAASKTMKREMLTSGSSYTVPAGVTYLNVTLVGGGGGGAGSVNSGSDKLNNGFGGQIVHSTLSATAGSSIAYAIGAGGTGGATSYSRRGGTGGTTTFTGATSAVGGTGGVYLSDAGLTGTSFISANNGGQRGGGALDLGGGAGGTGCIIIEYWV